MAKRTRSIYNPKYQERLRTSAKRSAEQGSKRQYEELRLKSKRANERMRQLERAGLNTPAYQTVQAKLEILGKRTRGNTGRRFSESGKATYNEKELLLKILDEFLGFVTSTISGANKYYNDIWQTANKGDQLTRAGISRDEWFEFWESLPDKKSRLYGSSQIVAILRTYTRKNQNLQDNQKYSVQEIADEIQNSKNLKDVYNKLGLTAKEVAKNRIKYE